MLHSLSELSDISDEEVIVEKSNVCLLETFVSYSSYLFHFLCDSHLNSMH